MQNRKGATPDSWCFYCQAGSGNSAMATAEFPGECTDKGDAYVQDINVCGFNRHSAWLWSHEFRQRQLLGPSISKVGHFCGQQSLWCMAKSPFSTLWPGSIAAQAGHYYSIALSRCLEVSIEPAMALWKCSCTCLILLEILVSVLFPWSLAAVFANLIVYRKPWSLRHVDWL